jgi:hypothetical protein
MFRTFALLALIAIPTTLLAQGSEDSAELDRVRSDARFRMGPLYATPMVLLKEIGVDSNVFNEAGEPKSDFTFTVAPKADIWLPVARRALLQGLIQSDLVWYQQYADERSIDPRLDLRGEFYLHRVTLFGERSYLNTRERPNYEVDSRSRHVEDGFSGGAEVAITPKFSIEAVGRQESTRYDSDEEYDGTSLQRTLNQDHSAIQLTARRRLSALTSVSVRYESVRDRFEYSPDRDSRSQAVLPGLEFKPRALISGSAYVGYREFTPEVPTALQEFSGLVAKLGLSYTLLGATTFGVSYNRDVTYSYSETEPFFVDNSFDVSIRRALGSRFDALVSAGRHAYDYREALTAAPAPTEARVDVTRNYAASIGYRLPRDGRAGFGVSYWQRESTTEPSRNYDNVRIGGTVTYGF